MSNNLDNKPPCCSKSPREPASSSPSSHNNHHHVRFVCSDDNDNDDSSKDVHEEFILEHLSHNDSADMTPPSLTPLPSAINSHPHHQHGSKKEFTSATGASFSDTVLALPNLPDFENSYFDADDANNLIEKKKSGLLDKIISDHHRHKSAKFTQSDESLGVGRQRNVGPTRPIFSGNICRKPPETNFFRSLAASSNKFNDDYDGNEEDEDDEEEDDGLCSEEQSVDENNNVIFWPTESEKKLIEHASYIFHKDRRADLERLTSLLPRGREYVVFNVFTDVARLFGFRRRKRVAFGKEFLEKYEQVGDVAGKDRFVPANKTPYKGIHTTSKKRKLSAVYSSWTVKSAEFNPKMDRVDHVGKCEHCFEKYFIACDCCRCRSKKPDLTNVMEGYLGDLNLASLFLHGHATRTFESALSSMEFIKYHDSRTSTLSQIPWATNYAKQRLGILSGSIWVFTYCVRTVIQYARDKDAHQNLIGLPSEVSFRKIMEQYAAICITISENVKTVLQYGHNFYNFCKECVRVIKVLQIHIGFKSDLRLRSPLKRGAGLDLNKKLSKREISKQKGIEVKVARSATTAATTTTNSEGDTPEAASAPETAAASTTASTTPATATTPTTASTPASAATPTIAVDQAEEVIEWKQFEELSGQEKASCLKHLLNVTTEGMNMVQTQLRFLMDDIVDSVKDVNEADLLFILADMFDRIKFLENLGSRKVKAEISQISKLMTDFSKDFQSFMDYGHHIIKRFIELRDMIHLCNEFMVKGLKIEMLSDMVPASTFKKKINFGCCGSGDGRRGTKGKIVSSYHPKYKVLDFFRVYYVDAVKTKQEIYANKFSFIIELSNKPITAVIPTGLDPTWGEIVVGSPRGSLEEYVENEDAPDDDESYLVHTGEGLALKQKPLLTSPLGSPRGSNDSAEEELQHQLHAGDAPNLTMPKRGSANSLNDDKQ